MGGEERETEPHVLAGWPWWAAMLALAGVYLISGVVVALTGEPVAYPYKSIFWPPIGLAVAAVLIWGYRVWPAVALGSLGVSVLLPDLLPMGATMKVVASELATVLAGAWLFRRAARPGCLLFAPGQMGVFILMAGGLGPLAGALAGTLSFGASGVIEWSDFRYVAWAWWANDTVSVLVWAPWALAWRKEEGWTPARAARAGAVLALLLVVSLAIFTDWLPIGVYHYPLTYLPALLIAWAAYRFGPRCATSAVVIVATVAAIGTQTGLGPFVRATRFETAILLQSFLTVLAVATLLIAAFIMDEQRRAEEAAARHAAEIKAARELDGLKRDFLSTVSHELLTPLASVVGNAELLEDELAGPLNPQQRVFLDDLQAGARRLGRLVDDMLDVVRLSVGTLSLEATSEDLRDRLQAVVEGYQEAARRKDLHLVARVPAQPVPVCMDGERIAQVIAHLVDNALKFTPAGGSVEVAVAWRDGHARVDVRDTGPGLPDGFRDQVFAPFSQAAATLTREHGGVGLGLALTRAIVEAHGGRLGVESQAGRGSDFWFTLPVAGASPRSRRR